MQTKKLGILLAFLVLLAMCKPTEQSTSTDTSGTTTTTTTDVLTVSYVAIDPAVFVPEATINGWINATPIDQAAIDAHRWALWGAMNASSGQSLNGTLLPVWETWYDTTTVFADAKLPTTAHAAVKGSRSPDLTNVHEKRRFTRPVQSVKHGARTGTNGEQLAGSVLSFNRFTQEFRDHVWRNHYYDSNVLTTLNKKFDQDGTPIAQRTVLEFPDQSIALKPVFWLADSTTTTPMPYWNGTGANATSNPQNPTPDTWKQCVLLDPTGNATNQNPITCNGATIPGGQYQVVRISENPAQSGVYAFKLTDLEAAELNTLMGNDIGQIYGITLNGGDYAVFVATHMTTREIANWTWQTFWYTPTPSTMPSQPPTAQGAPASIPAPWNNYASCTAYYMVTPPNDPNGQQYLCYNPYLETGLTGLDNKDQTITNGVGIQTNCMTCHRAAVWNPTNPNVPYAIDFYLDPTDPLWFKGVTKLEFSWATQGHAHAGPFIPPPGNP